MGMVMRQAMYCQKSKVDTSASPLFRRVATVLSWMAVGMPCTIIRTKWNSGSGDLNIPTHSNRSTKPIPASPEPGHITFPPLDLAGILVYNATFKVICIYNRASSCLFPPSAFVKPSLRSVSFPFRAHSSLQPSASSCLHTRLTDTRSHHTTGRDLSFTLHCWTYYIHTRLLKLTHLFNE